VKRFSTILAFLLGWTAFAAGPLSYRYIVSFHGRPEGQVDATKGQLLLDELDGEAWIKTTPAGFMTGWKRLGTTFDVSDVPYDSVTWDGSQVPPTQNSVRDLIQNLISLIPADSNWEAEGATNSVLSGIAKPWAIEATDHISVGSSDGAGSIAISSVNQTYTLTVTVLPDGTFSLANGSANLFRVSLASGYSGTGANFLADDGTYKAAGIVGDAFVIIGGSSDPAANGAALDAAYAAAKTKTPHGNALASDNRYTVILLPGLYQLASPLVLDADYIDIRGFTSDRTGVISFSGSYLKIAATDVVISDVNFQGQCLFGADGLGIKVYRCYFNSGSFDTIDGAAVSQYFEDCTANPDGSGAFSSSSNPVASGTFIRCRGGQLAFGSLVVPSSSSLVATCSGTFIDCEAGSYSFGSVVASGSSISVLAPVLSGTFSGCKAPKSFGCVRGTGSGCSVSGTGTFSGTFKNCVVRKITGFTSGGFGVLDNIASTADWVFSGVFLGVQGEDSFCPMFFGAIAPGGTYTFSGQFYDILLSASGFCGSVSGTGSVTVTFSGYFRNIRVLGIWGSGGFSGLFGGSNSSGVSATLNYTGTFIDVQTTYVAFGFQTAGTVTPTYTGKWIECRFGNGGNAFKTGSTFAGYMKGCSFIVDNSTGNQRSTAMPKFLLTGTIEDCEISGTTYLQVGDGARVYNCTIITTSGSYSIQAASAVNAKVAHCRMNLPIGSNVTNPISTPYNVVDSNLQI
jgi:hypothetical protein